MDNLVSQRQAAQMLQSCGLSRRAAYYRLGKLDSRELLDQKVYSRVDVDVECARIRLEKEGDHDRPAHSSRI